MTNEIWVHTHTAILCLVCDGAGAIGGGGTQDILDDDYCSYCKGTGVVVVQVPDP